MNAAATAPSIPPARIVDGRLSGAAFFDDPKLARVLEVLNGGGEETRVVGGAVRNALLGTKVEDVDLATTALPEIVVARAKAAGLRSVPTGIEHGTITLVVESVPFEVTTLREDIEADGRHAVVRFGRSFEADAMRRDFTINALSVGVDRRIYDYVGGLADLETRHVRFIGAPLERIREDYLRILRFFRFHATYGEGPVDGPALAAIIAGRDGLLRLSRERIRSELLRMLGARRAADVAKDMAAADLFGPIYFGIAHPARLSRLIAVEAARGETADPILRLAALAVLVSEDVERLRDYLRLSNDEYARLLAAAAALVPLHGRSEPPMPSDLRTSLFLHGRRAAIDALALAHSESGASPESRAWLGAAAFLRDTPEPRLPFGGADLLARGLPGGRAVGEALKRFQASWIRAGFPKDPALLARLLDQALEDAPPNRRQP